MAYTRQLPKRKQGQATLNDWLSGTSPVELTETEPNVWESLAAPMEQPVEQTALTTTSPGMYSGGGYRGGRGEQTQVEPAPTLPINTPAPTYPAAELPIPGQSTMETAYGIMEPLMMTGLDKQLADIRERYGAMGLGFGTDVMKAETDAARQARENLMANAMGFGYQYANLPIEQSMMLYQLGNMFAQPAQQTQQAYYQDWLRQLEPLNIMNWLNPSGYQTAVGTPQSYHQPGAMDYMMNMMPYLYMMGSGGGG